MFGLLVSVTLALLANSIFVSPTVVNGPSGKLSYVGSTCDIPKHHTYLHSLPSNASPQVRLDIAPYPKGHHISKEDFSELMREALQEVIFDAAFYGEYSPVSPPDYSFSIVASRLNLTIAGIKPPSGRPPHWTWSMLKESLKLLEEEFPQYGYQESGLIIKDESPEAPQLTAAAGDIVYINNDTQGVTSLSDTLLDTSR